jgi:hypothetical protein
LDSKTNYICQKCSKCESCGKGAVRLRYINTTEYGTNCVLITMVICDDCITSCALCNSHSNYLCISSGERLSRCINCVDKKLVQLGDMILVKNFTVD